MDLVQKGCFCQIIIFGNMHKNCIIVELFSSWKIFIVLSF
jgi:hypothetical protein